MTSLEIRDEASQSIVNFLKANVPRSDIPNIETELKKDFLLAKKRSKEQKAKKHVKKKSKVLTRKEKKALGFFAIPRKSVRYNDMLAINNIWTEYIIQILELDKSIPDYSSKNWDQFSQSLYKADFHGSLLQVVRSKCPSYVGKKGICIMDTKNTFKIVSMDNIVTTLPKKDCVFELYIRDTRLCIFGKHLCVRPAERATKKLKSYLHPDL